MYEKLNCSYEAGLPDQNSFLCLWSSWGEWGGCSSTCGSGVKERFRVFLVGQNGREGRSLDEDKCAGGSQEARACTTTDCPGGECNLYPACIYSDYFQTPVVPNWMLHPQALQGMSRNYIL